jgi:hypothetical protein
MLNEGEEEVQLSDEFSGVFMVKSPTSKPPKFPVT